MEKVEQRGRPFAEIDPLGRMTLSVWDFNDNLVKWQDRKGQIGEFKLGKADRLEEAIFRKSAEDAIESSYTVSYSPTTDLVTQIEDKIGAAQTLVSRFSFSYDPVDRAIEEAWFDAASSKTRRVKQSLDALGNRTGLLVTEDATPDPIVIADIT